MPVTAAELTEVCEALLPGRERDQWQDIITNVVASLQGIAAGDPQAHLGTLMPHSSSHHACYEDISRCFCRP